jgi:hypothetical protein
MMKNKKYNLYYLNTYRSLIILIFILNSINYINAQNFQPTTDQGIFSKLIEIKYVSELYLNNSLKQTSNKDSALANYNTLRWKIDGFVYQLSADMIATNSPRNIILLNKWCLNKPVNMKKIQVYINSLKEIENIYQNEIISSLYKQNKTLNLTTNVFYLIKDSYTIINDISAMKTQKTMAIIELLDHTRLLNPMEILKLVN